MSTILPKNRDWGVLLCINGTGILNSWIKRNMIREGLSYDDMNRLATQSAIGAKGLSVIPFGNGDRTHSRKQKHRMFVFTASISIFIPLPM